MKKFILNIILISILIFSGYNIYLKLDDYKKADELYDELRNINNNVDNNVSTNNKNKKPDLTNINSDFRGWIVVEGTNIDYPFVQDKDNNYYLHHDFNKNKSNSASIFMDYRNDYQNDKNTILYGHNMRNKSMFNNIVKFKDEKFWKENNKIIIYTPSSIDTYEVFSTYVTDSKDDYLTTNFTDISEFSKYLNEVKQKSIYKYNKEVNPSNKIITLSTCSYEFDDARTVVHGTLIKSKPIKQ